MTRWVKVEFLSHTMPGVSVELAPAQTFSMKVRPGEVVHTTYTVKNNSKEVFVGQAVPSVTPAVATPYFAEDRVFLLQPANLPARRSPDHAGGVCGEPGIAPGHGNRNAFVYLL